MALLDRFRSLPVTKHPDPDVRLAHVESLAIDEREQLASFAREDESPRVRRAAVGKLMDPSVLAIVTRDDTDSGVRAHAASMLRDIALEAFEETGEPDSLAAVGALSDPKILSHIAKTATRPSVAELALGRVDDARTRGSIARHATLESIRVAACASLTDREELLAVALNSAFKDTAIAAVDRLTDRADLEHVAERSNNKNALKRARAILRDMDEHAARDMARRRAESRRGARSRRRGRSGPSTRHRPRGGRAGARPTNRRTPRPRSRPIGRASAPSGWRLSRRRRRRRQPSNRERKPSAVSTGWSSSSRKLKPLPPTRISRSANRRHVVAQREWHDLMSSMEAPDETLAQRFAAAAARLTSRVQEAQEADRHARREALVNLRQLLERVEALAAKDDLPSKAAERALRDVRGALGHVPPLPSKQDYDEVTRRLKAAQAVLTPKLQALREIEGWQRWANVGIQEQLCEKMEALKSEENPEEIARRIRDLQQQWRQAADVPRAQSDALWQRFKKAHDEVWARCEAHFAAEAVTRAENLQKKIALCERVEALGDSTRWIQTADEIKTLQGEWRTVGPVSRGQEKAVWERFRAACDRFFSRRHEDLATRKTAWAENFAKKDALCVRAETLADSTDWDAAAAEIKRLQAEWKTIGPVKKSRSEMIWQRFRTACDRFFARYAQRHEIARGERVAAREAICAEVEAAADTRRRRPASRRRRPAPRTARQGSIAASALAAGDRRAGCGTGARGRARSTICRRVRAPARGAARSVRGHRPRPRRQSSADGSARRPRREARGVAPRSGVGWRRGSFADDAARRHAQGSARVQYHRRQGRRGQPRACRSRRYAAGAGQLVANRPRAGTHAARVGGSLSASVPRHRGGRAASWRRRGRPFEAEWGRHGW